MLRAIFVAALLVIAMPAAFADETAADWFYYGDSDYTTYEYYLLSGTNEDIITSFQIYAPVDVSYILDWSADPGWDFLAAQDVDTGGTILNWFCPTGVEGGLEPSNMLMVSITTPGDLLSLEEYKYPDCEGNWSYEVAGWPGSTPVMFSSVAVPLSALTLAETPEPSGILALITGLGAIGALRRRSFGRNL
ncbi:MAG: PEP-CTERM sorting domain-containing protein [Armatimonadetes bacterium]|nr:PEP-CTERM sorting domain-containing protein [Armatimonadota bacterium]